MIAQDHRNFEDGQQCEGQNPKQRGKRTLEENSGRSRRKHQQAISDIVDMIKEDNAHRKQ